MRRQLRKKELTAVKAVATLAVCLPVFLITTGCDGKEERIAEHLMKGKELASSGNYEKARLEFQNVLQMEPKHSDARFQLANALEKLDQPRQAAGFYLSAMEIDPENNAAKARLARLYFLGGAIDKARDMADEVMEKQADNVDAIIVRAGLAAQNGEVQAAIDYARRAADLDPGNMDAVFLLASLYEKQNQREKSFDLLQKASALHPRDGSLRRVLAKLYADSGDESSAIKQLRENIDKSPDEMGNYVQLARFLIKLEKVNDAEKVLVEAIGVDIIREQAQLSYVDFLQAQRGKEAAEKKLLEYIDQQPKVYGFRFALAEIYAATDRRPAAKQVYRQVIEMDGKEKYGLQARTRLAAMLAADKDLTAAEELLNQVLVENRSDSDALMVRGELALAQGKADVAIEDYRTLLKEQPDSVQIMQLLARAHIMNKERNLALDYLKKIAELQPGNLQNRLILSQILGQENRAKEALPHIDYVLTKEASNVIALELKVKAELAVGNPENARKAATAAKQSSPDSAVNFYLAGLVLQGEQKYDLSNREFINALKRDAKLSGALAELMRNAAASKNFDTVQLEMDEMLAKDRANDKLLAMKAELYALQGLHPKAVEYYQRALKLQDTDAGLYRNLAREQVAVGDIDGAVVLLQRGMVKADAPEIPTATLASLYQTVGKIDEAIALYEKLNGSAPGEFNAVNNLAMLLVTYRDSDQGSVARAEKLIEPLLGSSNPAYLDTIGWVYYKRGKYEDAVNYLQRASKAVPDEQLLLYHLGMAQLGKGDRESARENLRKSLSGNAKFYGIEEARTALGKIDGA